MDKKLKARWVKALRSGRYKQGDGTLKADGRYCCLGVLRQIADPKDRGFRRARASDDNALLSNKQLRRFGLTNKRQNELAEMNDGGQKFPAIADYIEKHL